MPYITEELWQRVAPLANVTGETIMHCRYPEPDPRLIDRVAIDELDWVKQFIMGIRQIRSEMNVKPGQALPVACQNGSQIDNQRIEANRSLLVSLAKLESITWLEPRDKAPESATALVGDMNLLIPLAGLIDRDAELARLQKNIDKLEREAHRIETKLANDNFVARAPSEVVDKEKDKLADTLSALASLKSQADRIASTP
jgi:valyl-tRNA synthetase